MRRVRGLDVWSKSLSAIMLGTKHGTKPVTLGELRRPPAGVDRQSGNEPDVTGLSWCRVGAKGGRTEPEQGAGSSRRLLVGVRS